MTLLWAIVVLGGFALACGAGLVLAARRFGVGEDEAVERINALLPQTQCAQCGYPGCLPYARAIAAGEADINQCPPGGQPTVDRLARLLGRESIALDPSRPVPAPAQVALIDEARCIGCNLCAQACPVDAIVGTHQRMHTVIVAECTGCELCLAPCPVDCIELVARPTPAVAGQRRRPLEPVASAAQ